MEIVAPLPQSLLNWPIGAVKRERMATPARFELATNRLGTYYSIQLSYGAKYSGPIPDLSGAAHSTRIIVGLRTSGQAESVALSD